MDDNEIVARITKLASEHNACNIQVQDGKATCRNGTPCCGGCKYLSERGCTVSAHGCRMWFCWTAWEFLPLLVQVEIYELMIQYKADIWFRHDAYNIGKVRDNLPLEFMHQSPGMNRLKF